MEFPELAFCLRSGAAFGGRDTMIRTTRLNLGFTLLEISLAVVIGLMMLSLALPSMRGLFAEQRLRERMEEFERFVGKAADLARTSKKEVRLRWESGGIRIVPEQELTGDNLPVSEGWDFFVLDKEETLLLTRTAARDQNPPAEWSFWPESVREPVELAYVGPGGAWELRFGALLAEPEVLGVHTR
jgi:type II secretory pathway pseudopilin PulG